jgi:hypothetical protein
MNTSCGRPDYAEAEVHHGAVAASLAGSGMALDSNGIEPQNLETNRRINICENV